jgi:uncharacterized protein YdbL (DUF1318 family)
MKNYRKALYAVGVLFTLLIFSCVTVNIYFPAEKVESVAGEIVDDIRNRKGADKGSSLKNLFLQKTIFALASSNAWADEVTTVSNPTIRALKEKMKARYAQMKPFYQKGMLVEGGNGYVSMGNTEGLGLKEKRDLKTLVDSENSDRATLYKEVAKALKIDPSQVDRIAKIFAGEWQK